MFGTLTHEYEYGFISLMSMSEAPCVNYKRTQDSGIIIHYRSQVRLKDIHFEWTMNQKHEMSTRLCL